MAAVSQIKRGSQAEYSIEAKAFAGAAFLQECSLEAFQRALGDGQAKIPPLTSSWEGPPPPGALLS